MDNIQTKRIYAEAAPEDGLRVLVDRLWPRGVSKDKARLDHWFRHLAPSDELRRWYGHEPEKWSEFQRRYRDELSVGYGDELDRLNQLVASGQPITLLFAARDSERNNAVALKDFLVRYRKGS